MCVSHALRKVDQAEDVKDGLFSLDRDTGFCLKTLGNIAEYGTFKQELLNLRQLLHLAVYYNKIIVIICDEIKGCRETKVIGRLRT